MRLSRPRNRPDDEHQRRLLMLCSEASSVRKASRTWPASMIEFEGVRSNNDLSEKRNEEGCEKGCSCIILTFQYFKLTSPKQVPEAQNVVFPLRNKKNSRERLCNTLTFRSYRWSLFRSSSLLCEREWFSTLPLSRVFSQLGTS